MTAPSGSSVIERVMAIVEKCFDGDPPGLALVDFTTGASTTLSRGAGHVRLADEISARFRALCETSGFAENFDALTGEGLRDRAYTWTASSYLLLARDHQRRGADAMTAATVV
jgi:hypothetical protein